MLFNKIGKAAIESFQGNPLWQIQEQKGKKQCIKVPHLEIEKKHDCKAMFQEYASFTRPHPAV